VFGATRLGTWAWVLVGVWILAGIALLVRRLARSDDAAATPPRRPAALDADVHRVLVVVDARRAPDGLAEAAVAHAGGRPTEAFVVVPASASRLDVLTGDEDAHTLASRRLDDTVASLARSGVAARGRVGAETPLQAIDEALREFPAEDIVAAIADDLVDRARRRYEVPVAAVAAARVVTRRG
jgi:hypothetical protein